MLTDILSSLNVVGVGVIFLCVLHVAGTLLLVGVIYAAVNRICDQLENTPIHLVVNRFMRNDDDDDGELDDECPPDDSCPPEVQVPDEVPVDPDDIVPDAEYFDAGPRPPGGDR